MKSCIYEGSVRHARYDRPPGGFAYSMFMAYLDLGELDRVFEDRWLWSARRPNLAWLSRADHFGDPSVSLDASVRDLVRERTGAFPDGPIRLLTHLRYFGYCFNPVSFYYCFAEDGETLETVVAEVNNTPWGERHLYVLGGEAIGRGGAIEHDKAFHVSPFLGMDMRYRWRFEAPGEQLRANVEARRGDACAFRASLALTRRPIDGIELARALVRHPFMTMQVVGGIYWQAFALWAKGAPFFSHPRGTP